MRKSVVTLMAVLAAASTAFAGVSFHGRIRAGYKFSFYSDSDEKTSIAKDPEARIGLGVADDDGLWGVKFYGYHIGDTHKAGEISMDNDAHSFDASATVNLAKALGKAGVDTGDFDFSFTMGYAGNDAGTLYGPTDLNAYNDPIDNKSGKTVVGRPGAYFTTVNFAYAKLVKAQVSYSPYSEQDAINQSFGLSAVVTPLDGVAIGAAYDYYGQIRDDGYAATAMDKYVFQNLMAVNATVDVAKLIKKDDQFGLKLSTAFRFAPDNDETKNDMLNGTAIYTDDPFFSISFTAEGGYKTIDAYMEYYGVQMIDGTDTAFVSNIKFEVDWNALKDLTLDAYVEFGDMSDELDATDPIVIGAEASYKFGGVTYYLGLEDTYDNAKSSDENTFTIQPRIQIVW